MRADDEVDINPWAIDLVARSLRHDLSSALYALVAMAIRPPSREADVAARAADSQAMMERIQSIFADLLDLLAVAEPNYAKTQRVFVPIEEVASGISHRVRTAVEVEPSLAGMRLHIVPLLFDAVVNNLIDNAFRASRFDNSSVSVRLIDSGGGDLAIDVVDSAGGVASEIREQLFRGPVVTSDQTMGGQGVGLFLGSRLVQLWGGKLELAETSSGGSRFRITLPMEQANAIDRELNGSSVIGAFDGNGRRDSGVGRVEGLGSR